jgi:hypothetical protein
MMNAEQLAQFFHETYNRLAPEFGHRKRQAKAKPWTELSEPNKNLLTAVAREMLFVLDSEYVLKWSTECASHQAAEQARVCACGHVVSDHIPMPAPDGTLFLLCTAMPDNDHTPACGETQLPGWIFPRCSIPAKVAG